MIRINLFGGINVTKTPDNVKLHLGRKAGCLLCLLSLSDNLIISREKAAGLIWSDREDEQARASLRQELSKLKHIIGDDVLVADHQNIWLSPDLVTIDVVEFLANAKAAMPKNFKAASAIYSGALLDGIYSKSREFENWVSIERDVLEKKAIALMIKLAQQYFDAGDFENARVWAENAIHIDPVSEICHRILIEALNLSGDRAAALLCYTKLKLLLKTELGISPSGLTLELGKRLVSKITDPSVVAAHKVAEISSVLKPLFGDRSAVAVLPFASLSDNIEDSFIAEGITEDVVNGLAAWRWFPIIGRYSTNHYRDKNCNKSIISNETGARYIVDGSVRRHGEYLLITVELCDGLTGLILWSGRFEGKADDLYSMENSLSDEIARRLEPEISRFEYNRLYRQDPVNLSMWEILHKARVTKFQSGHTYGTKQSNVIAMAMYRDVATLDPTSSDAISGIATCHWHDAINSWSADPAKSLNRAIFRAKQAVELDNSNYMALATVSITQIFGQHDVTGGLITARESIKMNPSDILSRHYLVCGLEFGGEFEEAIEQCNYMTRLDPCAPSLSVLYGDLSKIDLNKFKKFGGIKKIDLNYLFNFSEEIFSTS